ncbi:MAG: GerMN domain-containing protein, partial [Spirochaetia bacterium]|nr:GerMN domain-containing protein [Spirochaetia bacterium]
MRDYKNALNSLKASPARRKALPVRTGGGAPKPPSGPSFFNNYQFKFYAAIGVILLSVYFYVRYQIQNHPDSVFHELYMIVKGQVAENPPTNGKSNDKEPLTKSETDAGKKRSSAAESSRGDGGKDTAVPSTRSEDEDLKPITTTEVNLFLGSLDKKSGLVKLTPVKTLVEAGDQDPYVAAVKELLHFHSDRDTALVNTFPENVRLRSARIENGVLLLDFNQAFEFNRFGHLGLQVQIQQ